jgi:hypothetical protein
MPEHRLHHHSFVRSGCLPAWRERARDAARRPATPEGARAGDRRLERPGTIHDREQRPGGHWREHLVRRCGPGNSRVVPSDIMVRGNHLKKPLAWRTQNWRVKNLFELKNAQRVVIDGNLMGYNWLAAHTGYAVLFTVRNQNGTAPWSVVQDGSSRTTSSGTSRRASVSWGMTTLTRVNRRTTFSSAITCSKS